MYIQRLRALIAVIKFPSRFIKKIVYYLMNYSRRDSLSIWRKNPATLENTNQASRRTPRGKMAVALTTCCLFDSAARISFSRVIPMFIDDGSPRPPSIVSVLKHFTSSNTSSIENKEQIGNARCYQYRNIRFDKETIRTAKGNLVKVSCWEIIISLGYRVCIRKKRERESTGYLRNIFKKTRRANNHRHIYIYFLECRYTFSIEYKIRVCTCVHTRARVCAYS